MLRYVLYLFISLFAVLVRRPFKGRRRPSWSLVQEAAIDAMRRYIEHIRELPLAEQRVAMARLAPTRPHGMRRVGARTETVAGVRTEWFEPLGGAAQGVLLYFHGGGYVLGSIDTNRDLLHRLTLACRRHVLAVDYRLAPEHPYPAAIDDCFAVYRALVEQGTPAHEIVLAGDSAGGALALAVMLRARDAGLPLPAGAALLSPWLDLTFSGASYARHAPFSWGDKALLQGWADAWCGDADRTNPELSPAFAPEDALAELPPLLVQVGGAELLHDEIVAFAERCTAAGGRLHLSVAADMVHSYQCMASLFPAGQDALDEVGHFAAQRIDHL